MIRRAGVLAIGVAVAGVAGALATLNLLLLLGTTALFAFLASELLRFLLAPPLNREQFEVEVVDSAPRLPIGAEAPVALRLTYRGSSALRLTVVDTRPTSVEVVQGETEITRAFQPGETALLAYRVRTPTRGRHELGPTVVRRTGFLGLAFDEVTILAERPLFVTASNPALRSAPSGLALYTRVRGRLALRHRGYGSEFRSLRPYELSDDIRHIAWRRSTPENLLVREFEQESRQDYLLAFDVTSPMLAGGEGASPLDRAAEAAATVVGFVERSAEDRVGLVAYADGVRQFLKPARGSAHFRRIGDNLALLAARSGRFDLADLLERCRERVRTSTHLLVFSTLSEPLTDLSAAHSRFAARGHHLYLFVAEPGGFGPPTTDPLDARLLDWAKGQEEGRLARRFSLLHAAGVPTYRYDRRGATPKVIAAYGQIRAWGRGG